MARRFQFSLGRMLGAVALVCLAARLGVLMLAVRFEPFPLPLLVCLAFCTTGGAAVGCIEGRLIKGALWGLAIGFLVFAFLLPPRMQARE